MALVLAPVLPELLGDHQVVLGMHVLKRPLVVIRSGHSLNYILLAFKDKTLDCEAPLVTRGASQSKRC